MWSWFIWWKETACRRLKIFINFPIDSLSSLNFSSSLFSFCETVECVDDAAVEPMFEDETDMAERGERRACIKIENTKKILILFWSGWDEGNILSWFRDMWIRKKKLRAREMWWRWKDESSISIGKPHEWERVENVEKETWKSSSSSSHVEDFLVQSGDFSTFQRRIIMFLPHVASKRLRQLLGCCNRREISARFSHEKAFHVVHDGLKFRVFHLSLSCFY